MQGFINEMLYESRWEAIWVQSSLASNVLYTGKQLCRSVQIGINLRSLPYADKEKVLVSVCMELCAQTFKLAVSGFVRLGRTHDRDGSPLSTLPVECHHECDSGWQGRGANVTQVRLIMKLKSSGHICCTS